MRADTTLARTIAMLAAFAAGCADASNVTSPENQPPGGRRPSVTQCVRSNAGPADCSAPAMSPLRASKSLAASLNYHHYVQGLGSFSSFAQPTTEYVQGTTKIDISALTDLTSYNSISDGVQTVSFDLAPLERRTVPSTFATWSSPPESESNTPAVLFSNSELLTVLTLSQPAAAVGFELEPNPLDGAYDFLVEFYDDEYTLLGFVVRSVEGNAGARLFSFSTDWPKKISRVDISGPAKFAIAQVRYSLTPLPAPSTAVTVDIKPGTSPNDVHRSAKGRLPVAVLSTPTLNAANVDVASVTLGDEAAQDTPVAQHNKGTPMASLQDVDDDGDLDLILQFDIPALVANGDLTASTTQLVLRGTLVAGGAVRGVDNVTIKP